MIVAIVEAVVAVVVLLMPGVGFSPSAKPAPAAVVAAAIELAAIVAAEARGAAVVVVAPRGFSNKDRPPPAAEDVARVPAAELGAAPKVKPVPIAVAVGAVGAGAAVRGARAAGARAETGAGAGAAAAIVEMGAAKREGPKAGVACVAAGGAGVDDGLIPKANPPVCPAVGRVAGAVDAG